MSDLAVQVVAERLVGAVGRALEPAGFKTNRSRKSFTRKFGRFEQRIQFLLSKSSDGVFVESAVAINALDIQDFYFEVCPKDAPYAHSIGSDLPRIIKYYDEGISSFSGEKERYFADSEAAMNRLIAAVGLYVKDYGIRYIDENSSVERIASLLNESPRELTIHHWLYPMRAQIALIAAKLSNRADLSELLAIYSEEMKDAVEPYKSNFEMIKRAVG